MVKVTKLESLCGDLAAEERLKSSKSGGGIEVEM